MSRTSSARHGVPMGAVPVRAALVGAALVSLTACGGGGGYGGSTSAETDAAEPTSSSDGSEFCTRAAGIDQRVESAMSDLEEADDSVEEAFRQIADELRAIEPPEQIAAAWDAMAGGLDRMADAFAGADLTDPDSLAALEEAEGELTPASTDVEEYLRDECGIEP